MTQPSSINGIALSQHSLVKPNSTCFTRHSQAMSSVAQSSQSGLCQAQLVQSKPGQANHYSMPLAESSLGKPRADLANQCRMPLAKPRLLRKIPTTYLKLKSTPTTAPQSGYEPYS